MDVRVGELVGVREGVAVRVDVHEAVGVDVWVGVAGSVAVGEGTNGEGETSGAMVGISDGGTGALVAEGDD